MVGSSPAVGHAGFASAQLEGEISLVVRDPSGTPLAARVKLLARVSNLILESDSDDAGRWRAKHLPFGLM